MLFVDVVVSSVEEYVCFGGVVFEVVSRVYLEVMVFIIEWVCS